MRHRHLSLPAVRDGLLALLALLASALFGLSTPMVQHFGEALAGASMPSMEPATTNTRGYGS
jgi:hypothetical protein